MSEVVAPEPAEPTEVVTPEPETKAEDAPLGAPGLAALQAEREARSALERELKEFKDRDKTDAERQAEETETLRRENAELKSGALRATVAATKGVPAALLSGSTQTELEASADALIAFRGSQANAQLVVPNEGKSPTKQPNAESEFVASLFGSGD
jgi:hypothetical protein